MRVLRLAFKNLNSLAGEWDIDFTHPEYVSSGIFAITGPTGAGKSTILDALCVALYGQTPRLSRITQGTNEIMARQTGECFAEVEFETVRGRFRCHWSQHRSRRRPDGQLQAPRHEIAEAGSGQILESRLAAVARMVEEVTGMDFDRFTRSMLLAQGGFAAFLQASADKRAPILEQITGTAIYSRISIKIHERTSEERRRLGELQAGLDGVRLLSPEEAEKLLAERGELLLAGKSLTVEAGIVSQAQAWRERIAALEAELRQLDQERLAFEERRAAAGPELALLESAGRALILAGEHARLLSSRTERQEEQRQLEGAQERLPLLRLGWQSAFDSLELAENGLAVARAGQAAGAELIRATRSLDVRLGELQAQLRGLTDDLEKAARQNNDYRLAISRSDRLLREAGEELQAVAGFLDDHRADAGLAEALAGIAQQLKALKTLDARYQETLARLANQGALIESAALALSQAESAWQESRQAVGELESRLAGVQSAREVLLEGRQLAAWRTEVELLVNRQNRLALTREALVRIGETRSRLADLNQRREALEQQAQTLAVQEETLTAESGLREQVSRQLREKIDLLGRVASLEEYRRQLEDGAACPLCGATEHPYAAGNLPRADQARQELEQALDGAERVREQLARVRLEQAGLARDLKQAGQERDELAGRLTADETFCTAAAGELGVAVEAEPGIEARLALFDREFETGRVEAARRRGVIQAAEDREQEERGLLADLAKLGESLAEQERARLAARLGQEAALAEATRLEGESLALQADLKRQLAEVGSGVTAYGLGEVEPARADQLLDLLAARRNAYVGQMQARERLEKGKAERVAEREKLRALLAESERSLGEKERLLRERTALRDQLVEQRLELYGENNPDVEEKRLADGVRQAAERREAALQERNRLQAELEGVNQQVERLLLSLARRGEQLSGLESAFLNRLAESGFADEEAFLQACLPRERYQALSRSAESLAREGASLQARRQDRGEALAAEREKELSDKPLDLLREEFASVSARLGELQKALVAIDLKLEQHAEQQLRLKERLRNVEMQKRECARWEKLHGLIGSSDGKKFRNFAQGLTFELMVAHANRQLRKMSDRYILVRDVDEPLELNVIDNYQAGEIRSTRNLSGGESFIASLALSLGLSGMASRNVAVDSLFLDEGFGTLDEDALETALETLSGLQQEGKLIGIISHVPALRERIGTRIQVEAGSSGRSSLSGPGCRRIS